MTKDGFAPIVIIIAVAFLAAAGAVPLPQPSPLYGRAKPAEVAAAGWLSSWWGRIWRTPPAPPPAERSGASGPAGKSSAPSPSSPRKAAPLAPPSSVKPALPRAAPPPSRSPFGVFGDVLRGTAPPPPSQFHSQELSKGEPEERYGNRTPFYKQDSVSFEYYWPFDPVASNISAEETEILVHNESGRPVAITSVSLEYTLAGRQYVPPSGSWEKFVSRQSWDRTEYRIFSAGAIAPPFQLAAGEKGKLHYHIQFAEQPSEGKPQSVRVKISFAVGGADRRLDETMNRSEPTAAPPASSSARPGVSSLFGIPCQSNPNIIFDQAFAPLGEIAGIVPSGAAASEEIKPHSYVDLAVESIPLWAPADLELVEGAYYYEPPTFKVPTTYSFHFQVSCEVVLMLDHITDPVEKLKNAFPKTPQQDTRSVRVRPTVRLAKGELIGYTKGGGTQAANINRFDLGLYRTTNVNRFVNPARYERSRSWKYIHAVCPYDYFASALKALYYQKFTTLNKKPVPGAACRSPNQDQAGTLAGAWFFGEDSSATEAHVGIAAELDGSDVEIVGLPQQGVHASINRSNPTFKDPAAVRTEHCYFSRESGDRVLYFRLLSPMKAEVYSGTSSSGCPSAFPAAGAIPLFR